MEGLERPEADVLRAKVGGQGKVEYDKAKSGVVDARGN